MGIILSALGGGADATLKSMDEQQKFAQQSALLTQKGNEDLNREKTLEIFKQQQQDAPLQRVGAKATQLQGQQVPVQAAPVTSLDGVYASDAGPENGGFTGPIGIIGKSIAALPEGTDRDAALAQLRMQTSQANAGAQASVAGQTRPRTADEAFSAALDDLKVSDPVAYAAGHKLQGDKTVTVPDGATVITKDGKVLFDGSGSKDARQNALEDRKDARQQSQLDQQMRIAQMRDDQQSARLDALVGKAGGGANGTRDALQFIDGTRKDLASESANLRQMYAAEIKDRSKSEIEKIKALYAPKFNEIDAKRARIESDFNSLRDRIGLPPVEAAPAAPPTQAATQPQPTGTRPPLSSFMK